MAVHDVCASYRISGSIAVGLQDCVSICLWVPESVAYVQLNEVMIGTKRCVLDYIMIFCMFKCLSREGFKRAGFDVRYTEVPMGVWI